MTLMSGRPFAGSYPREPIDPDDMASGMSGGVWRAPTARRGCDWPQARDHMPPGLDLMLLPLAFAMNAADVFAAFWLRGR